MPVPSQLTREQYSRWSGIAFQAPRGAFAGDHTTVSFRGHLLRQLLNRMDQSCSSVDFDPSERMHADSAAAVIIYPTIFSMLCAVRRFCCNGIDFHSSIPK